MTVSARDKRALVILAVAVVLVLIARYFLDESGSPAAVGAVETPAAAEQRLASVRGLAARAPENEQRLKTLTAELEAWEKGLIRTETPQQAQAELLQILRRLAKAQTPPLEFRSEEIGQVRPLGEGKSYGEAVVSISLNCGIEQLVNLLAEITAQPEAIATDAIRISQGNQKEKSLSVRLTVAGLVPYELVPAKKGLASF
jgi:hypothetical protein